MYGQPVPALSPNTNASQISHQTGTYLQEQMKVAEKWVVLLGGREDWANTTTHDRLAGTTTVQDDHKFSGRAGVVYLSDIGLAPYVSYSQSFLPSSGTDYSGTPLKPTTGAQYEAGIRYQPKDMASYVTVSAYDIREHNVLETDPDHPGFAIQTGEIRSRGVDVEGLLSLVDGLDVRVAYTADPVRTIQSIDPSAIGARPTVSREPWQALGWVRGSAMSATATVAHTRRIPRSRRRWWGSRRQASP
jgi:iron complex outermembrane receptor protein